MILDGILDEETGEFIDDELSMDGGPSYPRRMNTQFKKKKRVTVNHNILLYNSLPKRQNKLYIAGIFHIEIPQSLYNSPIRQQKILEDFLR